MHEKFTGLDAFTGQDSTTPDRTCHFIGAIISAAAGIGGSILSSSASKSAARDQARSADAATALQRDIFEQNRADFAPFLSVGTSAIKELGKIFLGTDFGAQGAKTGRVSALESQIKTKNDELARLSSVSAGAPGSRTGDQDARRDFRDNRAADQSSSRAFQLRNEIAQLEGQLATERNAAVPQVGQEDRLSSFFQSPDFTFRRDEGEKAINRAAASRGLSDSGRVLKGLTEFNSNLASGEFNTFVNRLSDLAGIGSGTATNQAALGVQSGGQIGQSMLDAGTARASGAVGSANAFNRGLGDASFSLGNFFSQGNQLQNLARADVRNPALANIF